MSESPSLLKPKNSKAQGPLEFDMSFFVRPDSPQQRSSYARSHSSSHNHPKYRSSESKPQYASVRSASSSRSYHTTSHYGSSRARSRDGYVSHLLHKIKRILRRLYNYARRHPMKLFMLVFMPLITGGALADLLRRFGIRLPRSVEKMISGISRGRSSYGGRYGGGEGIEGVLKLAKIFI